MRISPRFSPILLIQSRMDEPTGVLDFLFHGFMSLGYWELDSSLDVSKWYLPFYLSSCVRVLVLKLRLVISLVDEIFECIIALNSLMI